MDLLTNGIVLEALGFTSIMNISPFCTANWILINPITLSSFARIQVWVFIYSIISDERENVGSEQALSPE